MIRRPTSDAHQQRDRPIRSALSRPSAKRSGASVISSAIALLGLLVVLAMLWTLSQMNQAAQSTVTTTTRIDPDKLTPDRMLEQFASRYGKAATHMMHKGWQSFGDSSIDATARRLLQASQQKRPFVMAFAGYSVTVGRGNYYKQSFPFVLGRLLEPLLRDTLHIPSVTIRNAAIGGIPSFPYGFCLEHFLGADADVVSWDYSMNEGSGAAVLETYIRQTQAQLSKRPMLIVLDTNVQRCQLLEQYVKQGYLQDAVCVGTAKDAVPPEFLELPEEKRPTGLQRWNEFGAPESCPGRGPWHPKKMEHEMIAWLMSLHFVKAVDRAVQLQQQGDTGVLASAETQNEPLTFPAPLVSKLPENDPAVTHLLYGHPSDGSDKHLMKHLSCRTNFLPATDQERVLSSIVVSGLAHDVTADNIMTERSDTAYQWGWVYDVSKVERDTKVKVEKCGGLGYVDMKIALYGIPESGTLRLWLPSKRVVDDTTAIDESAASWFDAIILCEANEKRPNEACHLDSDLEYTVGGVIVDKATMVAGAGEYLKRQTCVHVRIPDTAKITRLQDVKAADGKDLSAEQRSQLGKGLGENHVGIIFDLKAKEPVTRKNGACCVSHLVWEHH